MTAKHPTTDQTTSHFQPPSVDRADELDQFANVEQRELWQRYLEQQARRSCPGCGEETDAVL